MKKYYLVLLSFFVWGLETTNAQFVTIPDTRFASYLNIIVPSAMSGNNMDTTNAAVLSLARIDVENLGIISLNGVQYFKSLITLDCGNGSPSIDSNHITSLPTLPSTLDTLICGNNQILSLPALPNGLTVLKSYINQLTYLPILPGTLVYLDCGENKLSSLPILPSILTYLECRVNQLTYLPSLPGALTYLNCGSNSITNLPILPGTLTELDCDGNKLTSLPTLPSSLGSLYCNQNYLTSLPTLPGKLSSFVCYLNQLTSLPTLPSTISYLYCDYNPLNSLPTLPNSLEYLSCSYDQLTSLPALPSKLQFLECYNNQLTSLPTLPNIFFTELECENNNISCFPEFPSSLKDSNGFNISGNPFSCLPNYVQGMPAAILAYPLCMPGNPHGCPSAYGVVGFTYKDINNNCKKNNGDIDLTNVPVQIYNNKNGLLGQTYSAVNGVYYFDTGANYKVIVDTAGMPYQVQCKHPGADSIIKKSYLDTNINFSLTCKPGFDVGVQSVVDTGLIFPGMKHDISVVAGDMSQWYNLDCANGDSGTVQITISGPVTYVGPGAGALTPIISGNVFTYHISNYGLIRNTSAFNLLLKTDTSAKAGDTICIYVTVTPRIDNNPSNNVYQYCYYVINSHDPNNKTVYPVNVAPDYNEWFIYTIHYQNTGNAAARNILITDTLAGNLDASTFQLINYNYPNTTYLKGNVATFQFSDVNLPDSAANSSSSIGFIQYRIKPKPNLPNGTTIKNTGYIYFDYNPAIVTNTTINLFTEALASTNTVATDITCKIFPNPNNGTFTVSLQGIHNQCHIQIYNMLGQVVYASVLYNGNAQINLTNQATGLYFYRIFTENGSLVSVGKLVTE